jgi:REP element-mobilizing transposase RayT
MARSPRLFLPGAIYHVYCRTARGEMVFSDRDHAAEFVEIVADVKRLHDFEVFAWCLMGNHYHLVIRTHQTPLWRSMARIQCRVAREHNRRHGILGRLWQSRYKARIVREEDYYRQLLAYVHLNPVSAGIVKDPANHQWSGHAALIGRARPRLVDIPAALVGFGPSISTAREVYLDHVRVVAEARWLDAAIRKLPWWVKVANDDQIVEPEDADDAIDYRGKPLACSAGHGIDLNHAAALICEATGLQISDLSGRSRTADVAKARRALAVIAVDHLEFSVADVARLLQKHPGSVSRWLETPRGPVDRPELVSRVLPFLTDLKPNNETL